MRTTYIAAVVAVLVAGIGAKLFYFSNRAEATMPASSTINVSEMQSNVRLPVQEIHDMTFVFSNGD